MSIAHLLKDRADIKRQSRTFADGQWSETAMQTAASGIACRVSLGKGGREVAIAGQEDTTYDTTVWFDKGVNVAKDDEIDVNGLTLEVVRVVTNTDAPYVAALCRNRV